jgi:hypothetical protein
VPCASTGKSQFGLPAVISFTDKTKTSAAATLFTKIAANGTLILPDRVKKNCHRHAALSVRSDHHRRRAASAQ